MTMAEWIATLPTTDGGNVLLSQTQSTKMGITPGALEVQLASVSSVPPTYAELSALAVASTGGWQPIFDAWKAQGFVS